MFPVELEYYVYFTDGTRECLGDKLPSIAQAKRRAKKRTIDHFICFEVLHHGGLFPRGYWDAEGNSNDAMLFIKALESGLNSDNVQTVSLSAFVAHKIIEQVNSQKGA